MQRAAADVRRQLLETASAVLGPEPGELVVREGAVSDGERELDYSELVEARFGFSGGEIIGAGEVRPEQGTGSYAEGPVFWEVCVAAAEVEVERDTGEVRVRKVATCADVGKAINPQLVHRQDEGGAHPGPRQRALRGDDLRGRGAR